MQENGSNSATRLIFGKAPFTPQTLFYTEIFFFLFIIWCAQGSVWMTVCLSSLQRHQYQLVSKNGQWIWREASWEGPSRPSSLQLEKEGELHGCCQHARIIEGRSVYGMYVLIPPLGHRWLKPAPYPTFIPHKLSHCFSILAYCLATKHAWHSSPAWAFVSGKREEIPGQSPGKKTTCQCIVSSVI